MRVTTIFAGLALLLAADGVARSQSTGRTTTTAPSDAQIAAIAVAANQVDIDAAKVAKQKSKNTEVREFADRMITDHQGVLDQATALVKKLAVTPEESETSRTIKQGGRDNIANLKTLSGAAFDRAYADHEVTYHQQVIDMVSNTLIPNAKNPELKSFLEKVSPAFVAHLDHAKRLKVDLGKKTAQAR